MPDLNMRVISSARGIGPRICAYSNLGKWDMKGDLREGHFWKRLALISEGTMERVRCKVRMVVITFLPILG